MKTVHNERLKLTATLLNGLAIALAAVGGITPAIQALRISPSSSPEWQRILVTAFLCFCGAGMLHLAGRRLLGGLRE